MIYLLRLVEAMNFIHKKDRFSLKKFKLILGLLDVFAHVTCAGTCCRQCYKTCVGFVGILGNYVSQCCLKRKGTSLTKQ